MGPNNYYFYFQIITVETISVSQPVVIVISSQRLLPPLLGQPSVQLGLKVGEVIKVLRVGGVRGVRVMFMVRGCDWAWSDHQ